MLSRLPPSLSRLNLLLWTVRYLTPAQVWNRGWRTLRRRLHRRHVHQLHPKAPLEVSSQWGLYSHLSDVREISDKITDIHRYCERAAKIAKGHFSFIQHEQIWSDEPDWHSQQVSHLWCYHLHYFDYVFDLLIWASTADGHQAYPTFRRLVLSWITHNQQIDGDGWHPYTLSLRIVNWLHGLSGFAVQLADDLDFRTKLLDSIYAQTHVLTHELEFDVRGNHLLKNVRALIWVGVMCKGSEPPDWLARGLHLLESEIAEQILSDGGHFERAPGYHQAVLQDLVEIGLLLKHAEGSAPPWLDAAVAKMVDFLQAIVLPQGNPPLLKDTAWDASLSTHDLLLCATLYSGQKQGWRSQNLHCYPLALFGSTAVERCLNSPGEIKPVGSCALHASGYLVMRSDGTQEHLIFDVGKVCPDYLPAHAHADLLSYELIVGGQRIIVDSGVYEYTAGIWRDYFRSTRAHNTVEVAASNQSEVWGSFRVARRARPEEIVWESGSNYVLAQGQHDGYCRLVTPVRHRRTIFWLQNHYWLFIDQLWGEGIPTISSHIHIHPALQLVQQSEIEWSIAGECPTLKLRAFGHAAHSLSEGQLRPHIQGWYSEHFGEKRANQVLTLHTSAQMPVCFGYIVARRQAAEVELSATSSHSWSLDITHEEHRHQIMVTPDRAYVVVM